MKTYRQLLENGTPVEVGPVAVDDHGQHISASCWTDDPDAMDWPAVFSLESSWNQGTVAVGPYDNKRGELDPYIGRLVDEITTRFGGRWHYDASNCSIEQVEEETNA